MVWLMLKVICPILLWAFYSVQLRGAEFIERRGDRLYYQDKEFRFFSFAAPTLHQNEEHIAADDHNRFPNEFEIRDTLQSIKLAGGRVTRTFTFSIYSSLDQKPTYIEGIRKYNEAAFKTFDLVLSIARELGIHLIVPIIDSHSFYGWRGMKEFAALRGKSIHDFWTDEQLKSDYKNLLFDILNRKNTLNGVLYKDDPTILAWQFGNEFDSYISDNRLESRAEELRIAIADWSIEMARYLKEIDPHHLVMEAGGHRDKLLASPDIDIISDHYYAYWNELAGRSTDLAAINRESRQKVASYGKVLIVDEFGMSDQHILINLMQEVTRNGTSGGLLWGIRPHHRDGGYYHHNEAHTRWNSYHWPGFPQNDSMDEIPTLSALRHYAYLIRGQSPPPLGPPEVPPYLFPVEAQGMLRWRGSTGARYYEVERSDQPGGPWQVIATHLTLADNPTRYFKDPSPLDLNFYRIRARNDVGASGYSNVVVWPLVFGQQFESASRNSQWNYTGR